ncbi:MAG: GvpL/GvpF family gas vesicle protein [Deltaproteobacteria bacterium]|nr:GvpL/GvpF family gas vesicle protein [Deltaproteobacteria bacterium]
MKHEGKYIYGIIATDETPNFGSIGVGGHHDEVTSIGVNGLAAVVSNALMDHYVLSRENFTAHTKVIEKIMESHTVLPMRFCTVAETADAIISFLKRNSRQLKNELKEISGKVEVDIKFVWKEMKEIYGEIAKENKKIRAIKAQGVMRDQRSLVHIGELVAIALEEKKAVEGKEYLRLLKKMAKDFCEMEAKGDEMVAHAAFLVEKDRLGEFDNVVEKLGDDSGNRIQVHYVGPMPPFSFVNLQLHEEE